MNTYWGTKLAVLVGIALLLSLGNTANYAQAQQPTATSTTTPLTWPYNLTPAPLTPTPTFTPALCKAACEGPGIITATPVPTLRVLEPPCKPESKAEDGCFHSFIPALMVRDQWSLEGDKK